MKNNQIPEPVIGGNLYRPLVRALFADTQTMVLGVVASSIGVLLTAWQSGEVSLYVCAAIMLLVGACRAAVNVAYRKRTHELQFDARPVTSAEMQRWELYYSIGAVGSMSCLAGWCAITMAMMHNEFASTTAVAVTFANLIGVCGRNFPIARLINWQISIAGAGMIVGCIAEGELHFLLLAVLILPFIYSVRKIAGAQRRNLFTALTEQRRSSKLASQFNTALDNIPQAMCMFDAGRRIEVMNSTMLDQLGIDARGSHRLELSELMALLGRRFEVDSNDVSAIERILSVANSTRCSLTFDIPPHQTIKLIANPMDNGGMVATFEDISREVQAETKIEQMARFDKLTGLINREEAQRELARSLNDRLEDEQCAVLLINLDRFKAINDTLGHQVGDKLLCGLAKRLAKAVGNTGKISRYGGDEFATIIRSPNALDIAKALADQIIDAIQFPINIDQNNIQIGCTIGIAIGGRIDDTSELLMKQADTALFRAKQEGRGSMRVFAKSMGQELEERRRLETDLRDALEHEQFEIWFQPLVSVEKRRVTTCEALLRWRHPDNGMISPGIFVPIAEEMGLIEEIGAYVMREACKACATWPDNTRVAVNLSAVQFHQGDIFATVQNALKNSGLHPSRLELEITESLMLSDRAQVINVLEMFKKMGVRIALDDFGTGYSSLSYMNELPLDKVKIDRAFVTDLQPGTKALTLVQAITALGQRLGLSIVVEGIEHEEQLSILLQHAPVSEIQGYYFSKPVSPVEIAMLLDCETSENTTMIARMPEAPSLAA